jgi:hypothetical protein
MADPTQKMPPRSIDGNAIVNRVRAEAKSIDPDPYGGAYGPPNQEKVRERQFLNDYASQFEQFLEKNGNNGMVNERDMCNFSSLFKSENELASKNVDVKKAAAELRDTAASIDGKETYSIMGQRHERTSQSEIIAKIHFNEMADKLEAFGRFMGNKKTLSEADNLTFNLLNSSETEKNSFNIKDYKDNAVGKIADATGLDKETVESVWDKIEGVKDKAIEKIADVTGLDKKTVRTVWDGVSAVLSSYGLINGFVGKNPFTIGTLLDIIGVANNSSNFDNDVNGPDGPNEHMDGDVTNGEYTDDPRDPNGPSPDDPYYA